MKLILTESQDQIKLASYLRELKLKKKLDVYSKIPHETYTKSWSAKRKNTNEGVMPGVPDNVIVGNGLMILLELKKEKGGQLSPYQKEWIEAVNRIGGNVEAVVCKGYVEAKRYLDKRLGVTIT